MHFGNFSDIKRISQNLIQKNQKISKVSVLKFHQKNRGRFFADFLKGGMFLYEGLVLRFDEAIQRLLVVEKSCNSTMIIIHLEIVIGIPISSTSPTDV